MNASSPFNRSGWTRRLIVTVAIGSAAAAVTANVAFSERDAVGHGATQIPATSTPFAAAPEPSLPSAANALAVVADAPSEATPTF